MWQKPNTGWILKQLSEVSCEHTLLSAVSGFYLTRQKTQNLKKKKKSNFTSLSLILKNQAYKTSTSNQKGLKPRWGEHSNKAHWRLTCMGACEGCFLFPKFPTGKVGTSMCREGHLSPHAVSYQCIFELASLNYLINKQWHRVNAGCGWGALHKTPQTLLSCFAKESYSNLLEYIWTGNFSALRFREFPCTSWAGWY